MFFPKMAVACIGFFSIALSEVNLDVVPIYQYPDYYTACESCATVSVLNYLGFDITINEFLDTYLDTISVEDSLKVKTENIFDDYFVGNPCSSHGFLCNPPVEVRAVEKYFSEINEQILSPVDLTGSELDFLLSFPENGTPVVIWVTISYVQPTDAYWGSSLYHTPSHAVVLTGYNREDNTINLCDSISGNISVDYSTLKGIYNKCEKKSFCVR